MAPGTASTAAAVFPELETTFLPSNGQVHAAVQVSGRLDEKNRVPQTQQPDPTWAWALQTDPGYTSTARDTRNHKQIHRNRRKSTKKHQHSSTKKHKNHDYPRKNKPKPQKKHEHADSTLIPSRPYSRASRGNIEGRPQPTQNFVDK